MANLRSTTVIAVGILCVLMLAYSVQGQGAETTPTVHTTKQTTGTTVTTHKPTGTTTPKSSATTMFVSVPLMAMAYLAARKLY